jgi:amino acid adenylation domain-containing protein/thioester reductase-like protein
MAPGGERPGAAPPDASLALLARLAAEVLERDAVGSEQDLLALGADSLRAAQLLARVEDVFGVELSLDELFAAPTVAGLAAVIAERAATGAAAAGQTGTVAGQGGAVPELPGMAAAHAGAAGAPPAGGTLRAGIAAPAATEESGPAPLSFAQRRLWFLHQLEPGNPVHNLGAAVRCQGRLRVAALAAALSEIVRRHEALRTGFAARDGDEPVQVVFPPAPLPLPLVDLAGLPAPRRQQAAGRAARQLGRRPFDLERGRVVRGALLRLAAPADRAADEAEGEEHELALAFHHVAADGGSLAVLAGELAALYGAVAAGRPSPLAEPPAQYADFARWQRRRLTEAALAPGLDYWRRQLGGELAALELPADRPRPAVASHRGAHHDSALPEPLCSRLAAVAGQERATLFMGWLAVFLALIARITGQRDLVVGSPAGGRGRVELEGLIGVFLNNLVLRVSAAGEPGLRELLGRVRATVLAAFAHQEVPFERLVDELRPGRDLSRTPLFQVMFVGQNAPLRPFAAAGLRLEPREIDLGIARFDLAVSLAPAAAGWAATWKLATDLFDVPTVVRMAGHFENLLAAALAEPERPLGELDLLSPHERHQVLAAWNDTETRDPVARRPVGPAGPAGPEGEGVEVCLHELILEQAARTPRAVAVEHGAERLSYEELVGRAAALAARLRQLGVGGESRVGVAAERSLEMMVGLLGALFAGAAYVPLDPDYPAERLAHMLEDSAVGALLVQGRLLPRLGQLPARLAAGGGVIDLDEATAAATAAPADGGRPGGGEPGAAAYVIYTSGSTGRPKGAVVPHRGIVNRLLWMQRAYDLSPADRVLQKTPYSFDVSVWELFWPLITGARLVMAPPGAHQDPARLAALIAEREVTTLHFVPSMLQVFLEQPGLAAACRSVRRVFASGEALPAELAARFFDRLPGIELHNLYGPTEASVDVTFHACRPDAGRRPVPIGRPIANTAILLLDRRLQPVPAGVPGELHIGGVGLARGYLGRPELTAERFIPDPFAGSRGEGGKRAASGARLYKTGDLARFRPDGEVEFLGRLDHQVKVRGVRVEPGEIEAALARHPAVREAVVVARRDGPAGETRLAAYLVPAGGGASELGELRAFLRRGLPEAMIPAAFVVLPALPLTPSGKVDRRALPAPAPAGGERRAPGEAAGAEPGTPLERRLAALWRELLGVERVGRDDDFFALGGDSIQGAMLVNRVQRELGEIVYVMALFDAPTVGSFAAYLAASYPRAVARWLGGAPDGTAGGAASGAAEEAASAAAAQARETAAPGAPPPPPDGTREAERARLASAEGVEAALAELRAAVARRLRRGSGSSKRGESGAGEGAAGGVAAVAGEASAVAGARRNPPAVFLLSPFRSGSTLLRVMLAGHPRLFAPPELELLAFDTLAERRRSYSGRNAFAREGLVRAVMELRGCDAGEAERIMSVAEDGETPVAAWYRRLQEWSGGRLLVDKTPSYALDAFTLARAERLFERPLYVHLARHPVATVESYVEARLDRVYDDFPFSPETQAQLVWMLAHDNVLRFLAGVPAERQHRLRFEDLLREPRRAMEDLGRFLGVGFAPAMLEPYSGRRMTDGPRAASRMMGDPKFHQHSGIDAAVAERSRATAAAAAALAAPVRELAARLGYELPPTAGGAAGGGLALAPVERGRGELPLSFAQERLWFLAQLDPGSPAYNMPAALRLRGRLDVAALGASFAAVVRRHEVLRTTFPAVAGQPVQKIAPPGAAAATLPVVDLGALAGAARERERLRLALAEGRRPFDLARGPMLRATLLALGPARPGAVAGAEPDGGEHVLLVTLHHVVSDGWTVGVLVRELAALYGAFTAGRPSPLAALPLQYADYAWHQRRWLDGEAMAAHLAYWRRRLAGPLPPLELPVDRPRPPVATLRGARVSRSFPAAVTEQIRAFAGAAGTTFFLTLLAAWNALLHRYTGQEDLLLGIPIANRNRLELESLIGLFLNMVVQRTDAAGDPAFGRLLAGVKAGFLESIPHHEVPFEKLVEDLQPQRDLARAPIFQVQFSLQNTPSAPLALPGLAVELLDDHNRTTKFDLTVFLFDLPGGLTTTLEYNADLFDEATMARLLGHWQILAGGAAGQAAGGGAGVRLSELPLLAPAERDQLLTAWNPHADHPAAPALHELFARQAARNPRAVAAVHEVEQVSYGRLDERANRLANRLRALGVGPEVRVGLCVERSLDMLVGILGILKAGGAYVPLDPAYPPERLAWILADALRGSAAPVLVTRQQLVERFAAAGDDGEPRRERRLPYRVVALDDAAERAALAAESAAAPAALPGAGPDSAAYVIYTSGSTGRPKGVVVSHGQVVRLFEATRDRFAFGPADVWTVFHSYAFDFSVWEIWGALLHGGRLVVVPREVSLAPPAFYELLATEGVTVLNQTPSVFRQLVEVDREEQEGRGGRWALARLRLVIFGGEALDLAPLAPWLARHGDRRPALVNMYGITETTVHVTWRSLAAADLARAGASPVGTPIPDLQVHLLGRRLELLPVGVPGEIHVGGAGVARGYQGRPDLTAERFIPDPFAAGRPGARLYRSGDLARRRPDGDLDYLGRIDGQVKIRGFRIELGEIESALHRHAGVREAVVAARARQGEDRRLVAWVVPRGAPVPAAELREHLLRALPEHMVPAAFVTLDRLPVTVHGKVDRRALPEPEEAAAGAAQARTPPRTATEARLAGIWRAVLRRPSEQGLSREEDFFELGGHSLLVAQLSARVRAQLGVELPLRQVFEAPTLAGMAAAVDRLLAAGGEAAGESAPLSRRPRGGVLPLSFAQERLWFLDRLHPGSTAYNIWIALRFEGELAVGTLAAALRFLVRRHESLRTTFAADGGVPRLAIAEDAELALPVVDLSALAGAEPAALGCLRAALGRPFDLGRGPLLRALLVRMGGGDWRALVELHHIASDGWSNDVLVRELGSVYAALAERRPVRLPALPIQYADFAAWQRERFAAGALAPHLEHWRARLAGAPALLELPADRPRPALQRYRGRTLARELPAELLERLAAFCRAERATLFMGLAAALGALLRRHGGGTDLLLGTPVAGRDRVELEGLVGLFVNSVVLRLDLGGDPSFAQALARAREAALEAFAHQELPFDKLVEELSPERDLSHAPVFQVMLALQDPAAAAFALPGVKVSEVPLAGTATQLDLTLNAQERGGRLQLRWVYDRDLFDAATIARLAGHFDRLLASAIEGDGYRRIGELELLGAAERQQLREWNATAAAWPEDRCLHQLIAAQALRTPRAVAVAAEDEDLSYETLDGRANHLAHRLRALGVGPETVVAVACERSAAMVVALLAVLKAGGAYLPLDPGYPAARLAFMRQDAGARVLLGESGILARLGEAEGPGTLCLDRLDWPAADRWPACPEPGTGRDNLAYVIYTSGSTGRPKGTMNTHRGIVNRLLWMQQRYGLAADDRVLQKTPASFDVSVWELFWPLLTGARLVMARPAGHQDPAYLRRAIVEQEITTLHFVPAMLRAFLDSLAGAADGTASAADGAAGATLGGHRLRRVIASGEALAPDLQQRFHAALAVPLHNLYGPTEAAVDVTSWACDPGDLRPLVPIGRPVANTRIHLLDREGAETPIGVAGELHIGGVQVGRGYLGRPDLTAERFVPDPFAGRAEPGSRLYRTGDLARRLPDGAVDYLGRIDHQVKIRGFRIELGEIEAALTALPGVREAVVVARGGGERDLRLVAYVVGGPAGAPAAAELREELARRLPEHMIPAAFAQLPALPLTPSGKVDRRALPDAEPEAAAGYVAPRTPVEELLAQVWAEVLGRERVGARDDFFALGGHSLLATQVVSRLRSLFGIELPLRRLFEAPVLERFAAAVQEARQADRSQAAPPPIRPVPRDGPLPLAHAQERLWFVEELAQEGPPGRGRTVVYALPANLRLRGALRREVLAATLCEIVRRHETLRSRFRAVAGRPVQEIDAAWRPGLPLVDLGGLPAPAAAAEQRRLAAEQAGPPLDPTAGPLLAAVLVRLAREDHLLLVTIHHLVTDGWSMGLLLRELGAIYPAFDRGEPSPLPELLVQYADFAVWQRRRLRGEALDELLGYWRRQLAGAAPPVLPTDRPAVANEVFRAGALPLEVPPPCAAALAALARRQGASPFMVLLAGFQALLHRHGGQRDVAVATPIANRNRAEIEELIGFFVNTLVLRADFGGEPSFGELLAQVRETTLGAYDHQDLPYALLVEALRPDRRQGAPAFTEVIFNLQNQPLPTLQLPGLELEPLVRTEGADLQTQSSLVLVLWETGGRLLGTLAYNAALFDAATAARWRGHWLQLLAAAVAEPRRPLGELQLLGEGERHQVLHEWGDGVDSAEIVLEGDQPAAIGIWGEICIAGPGGAVTRTGRRGRRRADGSLELAPPAVAPLAPAAAAAVAATAPDAAAAAGERVASSVASARAELSGRREALSAVKRELLARRLGVRPGAAKAPPAAGAAAAQTAAPASGAVPPGAVAATSPASTAASVPAAATAAAAPGPAVPPPAAAAPEPALDLFAEAVLDPVIAPPAAGAADAGVAAPPSDAGRVLLTGATGFLGAFLLAELLRQTRAKVVCLVRAASAAEGASRLRANLERYEVWNDAAAPRIEVVPGDLSRPLLGLAPGAFDKLAAEIDAIVHAGAWVHATYPYAMLKAINVLGTQEILRLACRVRPRSVHFVSTLDVFFAPEYARLAIVPEDDSLELAAGAATGYAQTKWVAEKLVAAARDRGLPVSIYRFGRVSWHSETGIWNPDDSLRHLVDACLELGSAPDLDVALVLTPVDYVARAIVALSRHGPPAGKAYHLINRRETAVRQLVEWARSLGHSLALLPPDEWLAAARSRGFDVRLPEGAPATGGPAIDTRNAREALAGAGIACPEIDVESLRAFLGRRRAEAWR